MSGLFFKTVLFLGLTLALPIGEGVSRKDVQTARWVKKLPWKTIRKISDKYNIDRNLVAAIIQKESSGRSCVLRHERHYKYLYRPQTYSKRLGVSVNAEIQSQKTSYGLMQVMGAVAREMGYRNSLSNLCNISLNIEMGVRKIRELQKRYTKIEDIIAAYNAGSPRKLASGIYENQSYVTDVLSHYKAITRGV